MKTTLALTVLLGCLTAHFVVNAWSVVNTEYEYHLMRLHLNCIAENGLDLDGHAYLYDLVHGKENPPETTNKIKCAAKCLFLVHGIIYSNGNVAPVYKRDEHTNALEECARRQKKTSNDCDSAYQLYHCWVGPIK
ncbi:uncharacterized protein LOC108158239 [Drosophila miranda]|uniref:uncharacterized protein LOC108158239 n=1 Tax=Drosophila miranda TaxID=7229 RepID=UPI0007E5E049|nr:uncharacterized protein LOC108158239 [Drosophila miranda]